jgi:EAL domain-containing protein (putative c-di-GMP-specific phosphodiesterase class I)
MKSVTATITSIADIYDLETVAEGIETMDQLVEVNKLGIDVAQGYYYSKPVPKDEVLEVIENINASVASEQKAA